MYKKILILILSIFLTSCGYAPMYSKNIYRDLNIELLDFKGDREINKAIRSNLERYNNQDNFKRFTITTNSTFSKNAETKNLAGDITTYSAEASVTFKVININIEKTFIFKENLSINNQDSQFEEASYETNVKKNFAELFSRKLILQLLKIK